MPEARHGLDWFYVLLGESVLRDWRDKGGRLSELLNFARVRPLQEAHRQQSLGL